MADHISRNITPLNFRIVLVRCTDTANEIGAKQHQLKGEALAHFCDGIAGALLLASQLKGNGVFSLELDSKGPFNNYRCDATPLGLVRAMVPDTTQEKLESYKGSDELIGEGNLYCSKKIVDKEAPYSSVVTLEGHNFTNILKAYLAKSEQISGIISLCTLVENDKVISCDGFYFEELPDTKEADKKIIAETIKKTSSPLDLFKDQPNDDTFFKRLLGDDIPRTHMKDFEVKAFCPCTKERFMTSLISLPMEEIQKLLNEEELLIPLCDFCKKEYPISLNEIEVAKKQTN